MPAASTPFHYCSPCPFHSQPWACSRQFIIIVFNSVPGAQWNMWQRSPRAQFSSVVEPLKTLFVLCVSNSLLSPFPLSFLCWFVCLSLNHLFLVTLIIFYFAFFVCLFACYTVHRSFPCSVLSCMMFLYKLTQFWFLKTSFI